MNLYPSPNPQDVKEKQAYAKVTHDAAGKAQITWKRKQWDYVVIGSIILTVGAVLIKSMKRTERITDALTK